MLGFETKNVHPQVDALSTYTISGIVQGSVHILRHLPRGGRGFPKDDAG